MENAEYCEAVEKIERNTKVIVTADKKVKEWHHKKKMADDDWMGIVIAHALPGDMVWVKKES